MSPLSRLRPPARLAALITVFALLISPTAALSATANEASAYRVNVHPYEVRDSFETVWSAARGFSGGKYSNSYAGRSVSIAGTQDQALYQGELAGVRAWRQAVPSGTYDVTIKMREAWWNRPGERVFDISAEGRRVATGIDIIRAVGKDRAYDRSFRVQVTDGRLDLAFSATRDKPLVSAIEVRRVSTESVVHPMTFAPTQVVRYLANPDRGQYLWYPSEHPASVPAALAARDSYVRYTWRQIEPQPGVYNFALIDEELTAARRRGGTFSFRIMPVCTGCGLPNALPQDLVESRRTWSTTVDGETVRIPDWNDPGYLARWDGLMKALGNRYRSNPALGSVDTGGYGNWGEGHNWPYEGSYPRPTGQRSATVASLTSLVGSVARHFPQTYVMHSPFQVRIDEERRYDRSGSWQSLRAALLTTSRLGIRNDCLGGGSVQEFALNLLLDGQQQAVAEGLPLTDRPLDRWRIAPVATEWCDSINPQSSDGTFAQGAKQVSSLHVSTLSNGNFKGSLSDYPAAEQRAFLQANEMAGYRYSVRSVSLAAPPAGSDRARLSFTWSNDGVAPTYRDWSIEYSLRDGSGSTVTRIASTLPLRTLLGEGGSTTDVVSLPTAALQSGTYSVHASAIDPSGYHRPMALSSGVGLPDGSHRLGQLTLGAR